MFFWYYVKNCNLLEDVLVSDAIFMMKFISSPPNQLNFRDYLTNLSQISSLTFHSLSLWTLKIDKSSFLLFSKNELFSDQAMIYLGCDFYLFMIDIVIVKNCEGEKWNCLFCVCQKKRSKKSSSSCTHTIILWRIALSYFFMLLSSFFALRRSFLKLLSGDDDEKFLRMKFCSLFFLFRLNPIKKDSYDCLFHCCVHATFIECSFYSHCPKSTFLLHSVQFLMWFYFSEVTKREKEREREIYKLEYLTGLLKQLREKEEDLFEFI